MKFACENCGKIFRRTPARQKGYKKHFCSQDCHHAYVKKTGYGCSKKWKEMKQ